MGGGSHVLGSLNKNTISHTLLLIVLSYKVSPLIRTQCEKNLLHSVDE